MPGLPPTGGPCFGRERPAPRGTEDESGRALAGAHAKVVLFVGYSRIVTLPAEGIKIPFAMGQLPSASSSARAHGFTLLELLVVLVILGLIGAIAVPQVFKWLERANVDAARLQIEALSGNIDLYRLEVGAYPPTLEALVAKPDGAKRWNGPYLKKTVIPKDPWGRDYRYRVPGRHGPYDLFSLGSDGFEGGEGHKADIVSWK